MINNESNHTFNKADRFVTGWYWALQTKELKRGKIKAVTLMGRDLVVFRTQKGEVIAMDAICAHRGAHLSLGKVEDDGIRCGYHRWKYDKNGDVVNVPCQKVCPKASVNSWPVQEHYGLIWIWTGETPTHGLLEAPELQGMDVDVTFGAPYVKNCHPNVVMCDAIDVQHFQSVHNLSGDVLDLSIEEIDEVSMEFKNIQPVPKKNIIGRMLSLFYKKSVTFNLRYMYGTSGTITVGPDFFHFHVMFTNRIGKNGSSEGQTVILTKNRKGPIGWVFNRIVLFLGWAVADYFRMGDTPNFNTMQFDFKTPIKADQTLIRFIKHVENQEARSWGDWSVIQTSKKPTLKPLVAL